MAALHTIENEFLKVVVSEHGAELQSLICKSNKKEYLWQGAKEVWSRRAPVLFPIVGRLCNDTFYHQNKSYKLGQHGFARDKKFDLLMSGSNQLTFLLTETEETLAQYPFCFNLYIGYTLEKSKVKVVYEVQNTGEEDMYFSIGGHPAFNCPLTDDGTYEDYSLTLGGTNAYEVAMLKDGLQTGEMRKIEIPDKGLKLSKKLFENDALVFKQSAITKASLRNKDSSRGVDLSTNMPFFGIWSKKDNDQFVCLEPWQGVADHEKTTELRDKEGINLLSKGQIFNSNYEIEVL